MEKAINIAVDAMGGDKAPTEIIKGALKALEFEGVNVTLVGRKDVIEKELKRHSYDAVRVSTVHASEIVGMSETPTVVLKQKKDSSMMVGLRLLKEKNADAFVSAGNTGALLSGAMMVVGRLKGVERPALAVSMPTERGFSLIIDCGANMDAKPSYLKQFGEMGSIYMETVLNVEAPKIALANIGVEKEKGNALTKGAYEALSGVSGINFIGNIEARDIPRGCADVIICDAFTGNIILKYSEGFAKSFLAMMKRELMSSALSRFGAFIASGGFRAMKKKFNADEIGGAPFLGVSGVVVKAHGSSGSRAMRGAIAQCAAFVRNDFIEKLEFQILKGERNNGV
ncbi:MAG: phosphate acyltransferase PlsX [Clostridiales bacterium]|jgi:glycerol-3-phosphate acyltransferase PlsX|nr:phosphate acyltransferase PlsX [Clostridiales bacterium]